MKKIVILCMLIILSSCTVKVDKENEAKYLNYRFPIYEITYKEHDYIVFSGDLGLSNGIRSGINSGVVHSPDCRKCNNSKK